jgi:mRNA interferase RelE/StbE
VPQSPSELRILPAAQDDLAIIQDNNADAAQRCLDRIKDWNRKIQWGRVPQDHLTYLTGSGKYNFYRERVGNSAYRIVYEISGDQMTAVAVFPKDDNAYDLTEYDQRMDEA